MPEPAWSIIDRRHPRALPDAEAAEDAPTAAAPTEAADGWPPFQAADASLMVPQQAYSQTEPTRYDADYPPTPAAGQPAVGQPLLSVDSASCSPQAQPQP